MLLSVIVPVFQGEKYLDRLFACMCGQSFQDFELIFIDDGSTDKSAEICDGFKKNDSRVNVIHQENQGILRARQAGVEKAKGDYVTFIDCDDDVEGTYIQKMYELIEKSKADIVITGYKLVYEDGEIKNPFVSMEEGYFDTEEVLNHIINEEIVEKAYSWEMVGKLYKSEFIKMYRFHEGYSYAEDFVTNWELIHEARSIFYYPYYGYFYYKHASSMTYNRDGFRAEYVVAIKDVLYGMYTSGSSWRYMLRLLEDLIYQTMHKWVFSSDSLTEVFSQYQELLRNVLEQKLAKGETSTRHYEELDYPFYIIRDVYRKKYQELLDSIIDYANHHTDIYIFGTGVWSERVRKILDDVEISFRGAVVSSLEKKVENSCWLSEEVLLLSELEGRYDVGVIVCASDNSIGEIITALKAKDSIDYLDVSTYRELIRDGKKLF